MLLGASPALAQRDTVVVAGARYAKSGLHHWLFGRYYRDLWNAPVIAPILDLRRQAGGLEPTRLGGGQQTKTLRFRGADGYSYVFRSIDKTPDVLPSDLEDTFLQDVLQDQTRALHPGGALIAARLLDAAGIPHAEPTLVVMPDVPELGEFREEFANRLGTFSRRVTIEENRPTIAGARQILDSDELWPRVFRSPANRIDARALGAARLMDLLMGDWDRHRANWSWARMSDVTPRIWVPVPEDRDNAFVRFNGILLRLVRGTTDPQLVTFGDEYSKLDGMSWNGRDLDRWFLGALDGAAWDSLGLALQAKLTDAAIDSAVEALPEGWRALDGPRLTTALRQRRDSLPVMARVFYQWLAKNAEVHLTAADEDITIDRTPDGVVLTVAERGRSPWFERTYDPGVTDELRVVLRGGADHVLVRGDGPGGIRIRIIGDSTVPIIDSSRARGVRRHLPDWERQPKSLRSEPRDTTTRDSTDNDDSTDELDPPPPRDWGTRRTPAFWIGGGPDVGVFLGTGSRWITFGFRKLPWASLWTVRAGWATQARTGRVMITGVDRRTESRTRTEVRAWASGIEVLKWHGVGNQTTVTLPNQYYRVNRSEVGSILQLVLPVTRHIEVGVGPAVSYAHTRTQASRIIADSAPYGTGGFGMAGLRAGLTMDTRDFAGHPTRGVSLTLGGSAYPAIWTVRSAFSELHASGSTYFTARRFPLRPTLALRAGGKKVFGRYPFGEAAFIGDPGTVRLGRTNRFAGDAAAWGGTELRLALTRFRVLLPGELGVFGLAETGRVWAAAEQSTAWHSAVGGGLWISLIQPQHVISVAVASSRERTGIYVTAGMAY